MLLLFKKMIHFYQSFPVMLKYYSVELRFYQKNPVWYNKY